MWILWRKCRRCMKHSLPWLPKLSVKVLSLSLYDLSCVKSPNPFSCYRLAAASKSLFILFHEEVTKLELHYDKVDSMIQNNSDGFRPCGRWDSS